MHQNSTLVSYILQILLTGVSVLIVGKLLPGVKVRSYGSAVLFAFIVSILDVIAWKFLGLLTLPFAVVTAGLGVFVINGILFMIADAAVPGVQISGCVTAVLASVGVTLINWVMHFFLGKWAPH